MILVTGGTGLVGSHLLFNLINSGKKVRAIKRENSSLNLTQKIFSYYSKNPDEMLSQVEWVSGDIADIYSLYEAMDEITHVFHAAAIVSFNKSEHKEMMKINVGGTANVVNACLYKNVKKLCHVSSIATLGRADNEEIINEEIKWKNSKINSVYSISKYGAEREVWRGTIEGLPAVIVNPSVIIGPGNWKNGSCKLFEQVWSGLKFYTDGTNGYIDVRDVASAMIMLMDSNIENSRFIISSENIEYLRLFSMIADGLKKERPYIKATPFLSHIAWRAVKLRSLIIGKKPLITKETARTAFQKYSYSNEKIKKTTGIEFIPIQQSISDTCKLFLKDI